MKTYRIPMYWTMWGVYEIEAENQSDAMDKAMEWDRSLPDDSSYVDDSIAIDMDGLDVQAMYDTRGDDNNEAPFGQDKISEWICPNCNGVNTASETRCYKCTNPRQDMDSIELQEMDRQMRKFSPSQEGSK